ncbi:MAG: hypothetical protein IJX80_10905 [Clostridia bacterium]|nr:hypothetical protein [Clostridia bacterium]
MYRDLTFDTKTYHGTYKYTRVYHNGRAYDEYECEDGATFKIFSDEASFSVVSDFSKRLKYYTSDKFDEASIKGWLESYIAEMFPTFNMNEYTYSCRTSARVKTDLSSTGMSYDYFYEPQSSNESVSFYYFYYDRVIDGIKLTGDGITVITDGNGNIRSFYYHCVGNYDLDSINVSDIDFLRIDRLIRSKYKGMDIQCYFQLTPDKILLVAQLLDEKDHFYVHIY